MFRSDRLKAIAASAFAEAAISGGFKLFAYVIMADHVHFICSNDRTPSDTLRFLKGISAKRIIDHLKERGFESSLRKLRNRKRGKKQSHSLWQHHSNTFFITTEFSFMQKLNYIHLNPVKEGLTALPSEFRYSSARIWQRKPFPDEPIQIEIDLIEWSKR